VGKVLVGAGLIYSVRSLVNVNRVVSQVSVPGSSLLAKHSAPKIGCTSYKDAYKIDLPANFKLIKNTGSKHDIYVQDFARSFFKCKVFSRLEKPIILNILKPSGLVILTRSIFHPNQGDDQVLNYGRGKFKWAVGDKVLLWEVVQRKPNEILLKWAQGGTEGTTWFYIPRDENALVFGSSITINVEEGLNLHKNLYVDQISSENEKPNPVTVFKALVTQVLFKISVPFHILYSKYLLLSTHNCLMEERKNM